jgi:hypothetical protein
VDFEAPTDADGAPGLGARDPLDRVLQGVPIKQRERQQRDNDQAADDDIGHAERLLERDVHAVTA